MTEGLKILQGRLLGSTIVASAMLMASPAYAQAQNPAQEAAEEGTVEQQADQTPADPGAEGREEPGEVVVTGSRIRRPDLTSSSPLAVATSAEIATSGEVANVESFLNELPQFVPFTTGASNNPGNGLAVVDLRGAGPSRTLVLVDGKRFVPSTLGGTVDLNNIPTPLVDRVEVVTGGASAVYGSDALAGVVNFVLKRDFEGVELNGFYKITERGDSQVGTLSATVGGNFGDGRGNAALFMGYTDRKPTFASEREWSRVVLLDSVPNAAGTAGGCVPGTLNEFNFGQRAPAGAGVARVPCFVQGGSSGIPGTLFFDIGRRIDEAGQPVPFVNPDDLYNFAPPNYLQIPQQRWIGTALAHYEISEAVIPFARATLAWNKVPRQLAPTPIFNFFDFNLDNPYMSDALRAQLQPLDTDGDGIVNTFIGRRMLETGPRQNPQETYSIGLVGGVRGDISRDWAYELFYSYGRTSANVRLAGDVSFTRFQQSLLATRDANGNIVCLDPSGGCVPSNIFGPNNMSPEAADFVSLSAQSQSVVKAEAAGGSINGRLPFRLFSTEAVGVAFGAEYRAVSGRFDPDEALQNEVLGFNRTSPTAGKFDVKELFGEASIPIANGLPFVHDLRATGAVRVSEYSQGSVGTVWTYAAGAEFAPVRDIRFRGQYQRAIRAPNIGELYAGQGNNFPAAVDPCSNQQPVSQRSQIIFDACVRSGVPSGIVWQFTPPGGTQVETLIGGNPDLSEEVSDTWTVGAVLTPRFLPGLNATVDYYKITIDDAIATFGGSTQNILNTCYTVVGGDPTNVYCQAIIRNPNSTIDFVRALAANVSSLKFEGVDWQVDYRTRLPFRLFGNSDTAIALIHRGTRAIEATIMADPVAPVINCVGFYGQRCANPTPKWRLNNQLSFTQGPVGFTLQHRYLSKTFDDRQMRFPNPNITPPIEELFTPIDRPSSRIGGYHMFDASVNFDVSDHMEMTLGVENIFDRDPPIPGDSADEQNNTYPSLFDPFGRRFFVSVRNRF